MYLEKKTHLSRIKKCFKTTANSTWEAGKGARKQREKQEKTRMKTKSEINTNNVNVNRLTS